MEDPGFQYPKLWLLTGKLKKCNLFKQINKRRLKHLYNAGSKLTALYIC